MYQERAGTLLRPTYNTSPAEVEFEKHQLQLECTDFRVANYDVSIEGLGWFSIQGKGFADLFLRLPSGLRYHVRESAMRPWELRDKGGLNRYTGMTIAAKTAKN